MPTFDIGSKDLMQPETVTEMSLMGETTTSSSAQAKSRLEPPFDVTDSVFEMSSPGSPRGDNVSNSDMLSANEVASITDIPVTRTPTTQMPLVLPTTYRVQDKERGGLTTLEHSPPSSIHAYFSNELDVSRLNKIHKHLWLAGLERPAYPLHRQCAVGLTIVVIEQVDLHLLWDDSRMFVKPLPDFLLSHSAWSSHLCEDAELHAQALGFLKSYLWLVSQHSDLKLAHSLGLIPEAVTWEKWNGLTKAFTQRYSLDSDDGVNCRYWYGQLRIGRVNWIFRLSAKTRSFKNFTRGYLYGYNSYGAFFERNLAWLVATFVYVTIVLTAMQVGLATEALENNRAFQNASYGFTVFSIFTPLIVVGGMTVGVLILVYINLRFALSSRKPRPATNV